MGIALLIARLGLACVFAYAAIGKAMDLGRTRTTLARFGMPEPLVAVAAVVLPALELVIAIALVPATTAIAASVAAVALLVAFSIVIARAVRAGDRHPCNCLGAHSRARALGAPALIRNALLALFALAVALVGPGTSIGSVLAGADPVLVAVVGVAAAIVAAQAWLGFALFRQNARLLERIRRLELAERQRGESAAPGSDQQIKLRVAR